MLKTIGVFGLVLIEIGGIHKKVIFPTNNVVRPLSHTRQAKSLGISNMHRMTVIASQIFAVFEANPRRSIPIAISQRSPNAQAYTRDLSSTPLVESVSDSLRNISKREECENQDRVKDR